MKILRSLVLVLMAAFLTPLALMAQTVQVADTTHVVVAASSGFSGILGVLVPILVAALTFVGFEGLQKAVTFIDKLPSAVKQIAVGAIAFLLTTLSAKLGVHLSSTDIGGLSSTDLSALISSGLAFLFHAGSQAKVAAVATGAKVGP